MIKTSAHTMATPDLALQDALSLFAQIGFDGVEIIYADDYLCAISTNVTLAECTTLKSRLDDVGLAVPNLVPYVREVNALDENVRRQAISDLRRCIDVAAALGSASVRIWAGNEPERGSEDEQYALLISSLQDLGRAAGDTGVTLSVENHMGSHAISGSITRKIIDDVGSSNVGILYDPANLLVLGDSDYQAAFEIQAPRITHVHFKDVDVLGDNRHMPKIVGEGEVPWEWIVPALAESGYDRYVTTEYEKRWHPDELPSSRAGLTHELGELRKFLTLDSVPGHESGEH
jgi:sugar phosphate isomerase/epimerase